jgi:hypothetical protein
LNIHTVLLAYTHAPYHHSLLLIVNTANLLTGSLTTLTAATVAATPAATVAATPAATSAATVAAVFEGLISLFNQKTTGIRGGGAFFRVHSG